MDAGQLKSYTKMITARSCAVAAGHQGMLIIIGGQDDKGKILCCTELYDSKNGQWYMCSDIPQPHYWLKSVIVDDTLYLLGGINNHFKISPVVFTTPLHMLLNHQLKWSTNQDTPWCESAPVCVNGSRLLIVGGWKSTENRYPRTTHIYKLSKVTHNWEIIGHIPSAVASPCVVSTADNRIIVIGGKNNERQETNTVWIGLCKPQ